jgi:hypothetical protein
VSIRLGPLGESQTAHVNRHRPGDNSGNDGTGDSNQDDVGVHGGSGKEGG